jgi:hypothetical protein
MIVRAARLELGCLSVPVGLVLLIAGCGGGEFASELEARPTARALSQREGQTLRLPHDERFSIALAPTQETPGLGGTAEAEAHASKDGSADATARVENGGSAQAGFQLGHAVKNDSDRQMELHVRVRCGYELEVAVTPATPTPGAKVGLKLYARDGRNRLLRAFSLAQHSTEEGAAQSRDSQDLDFRLTLAPYQSVSLYVGGGVEIETPEGRSAEGTLNLRDLEMQITTEMAPPVRAAGDEQD